MYKLLKWRGKKTYLFIFQCIIILFGYVLLWNRIRFGIEFTDESWYVAEPYIVANGAIPYVNNWTQASGFTLPLALLFKLYVMLTGGTEGIVLYSRILYVIVSFVMYAVSIFLIAKRTKQTGMLIAVFPLLFLVTNSLYDLNYNTIGVIYLFIGCVLLLFMWDENGKSSIVAGVLIARAIIASPSVLAGWGVIVVLLIVRKQYRQLGRFILGNEIAAILVVGWCCIQGGILGFINGMRVILTELGYFQISQRHTFRDDIIYIFNYCKPFWMEFIILGTLRILWKKNGFFSEKLYTYIIILAFAVSNLIGIKKGITFGSYFYLIRYGWFQAILMALFVKNIDAQRKNVILRFAWISVGYLAVYILTSATNVYGFGSREYWLIIPTVLGYLSWIFFLNNQYPVTIAIFLANLLLGFLLIDRNYGYIYRDQPIVNLTQKVEYGIWKGCYTTPERAENVKLLEKYIRSITSEEDDVLFLDQVCFAYLMTDGKACSPTTLDPMAFSYKADTPEVMYEYFESTNKMPNKIIYIDFGRDEDLSIDSDWKFNKFVGENYELVEIYDTNPEIIDKCAEGEIDTASFHVKYYTRRKNK